MTDNNKPAMKISFGVKATAKSAVVPVLNQKLQQASDSEEEEEAVPAKRQKLAFFEDGTAPMDEDESQEKLVIPIVKQADWRTKKQIELLKAQEEGGEISDEDRARLRLLQESVGEVEAEGEADNNVIAVAEVDGTGEDADYSQVPMEGYGLAILRGCGWKDGEGLGKNKVKVVMKHPEPRPKGLGLGAVPRVKNDTSAARNTDGKESKTLKVGSLVKIVGTSNNGAYGKVEGMEEENASVFVNLALKKKTVRVSQYAVELVTKEEYERDSKCINKKAYDEAKNDEIEPKPTSSSTSNTAWIQPDLRVRFIDKKYEKGRYYKQKMIVLDAPDSRSCKLKDDKGEKHRRIKEDWLETIIPKVGAKVMIVTGRRRGKLAELVERDTRKERVYAKLESGEVLKFTYDDVCEYVERN